MSEIIINELLEKLKQCDDFHNRCDFLMEHSEITYMLDYITKWQQENKELQERINKSIKYISSNDIEVLKYHDIPSETTSYEIVTVDLLKILKGGENDWFKMWRLPRVDERYTW